MSISLSSSLCLGQHVDLTIGATLKQSIGESAGDIPMYSLHRIRRVWGKHPMGVGRKMAELLLKCLVEANEVYKQESGNHKWNCLTSNNLVWAIDLFEERLAELAGYVASDERMKREGKPAADYLDDKSKRSVEKVKSWFDTHSDDLIYDMSGAVPWDVVRHLQASLSVWIGGNLNPFTQDINTMVLEVAKKRGVELDDPEDAWIKMGGRLFTDKS